MTNMNRFSYLSNTNIKQPAHKNHFSKNKHLKTSKTLPNWRNIMRTVPQNQITNKLQITCLLTHDIHNTHKYHKTCQSNINILKKFMRAEILPWIFFWRVANLLDLSLTFEHINLFLNKAGRAFSFKLLMRFT